MEVKQKGITLCLGVNKKVSNIAITMDFPYKNCSPGCLNSLLHNRPERNPALEKGSEEAALAFAIYEYISEKVSASVLEISKSRSGSNIFCKSLNGNLVLYWECQGTGSSLRKNLSLALGCLVPHKLFSKYKENMKFLGAKGVPKEHFNFCVKKMIEGIKSGVNFVAVGKITTNKEKLGDILAAVVKKYPTFATPPASETQAPEQRECTYQMYPTVACTSGIGCIALADYIKANSGGMNVEVHTGVVEIYNNHWESKRKSLADNRKIGVYVDRKYKPLKDAFPSLFAYYGSVKHYADCHALSQILKKKITPAEIKQLIVKHL